MTCWLAYVPVLFFPPPPPVSPPSHPFPIYFPSFLSLLVCASPPTRPEHQLLTTTLSSSGPCCLSSTATTALHFRPRHPPPPLFSLSLSLLLSLHPDTHTIKMSRQSRGNANSMSAASNRQNEYFVPRDGIDREVITADICRYLGNDALVRPGTYEVRLLSPLPVTPPPP